MRVVGREDEGDFIINQWANEWISVRDPKGQPDIIHPTKAILTDRELALIVHPMNNYGSGIFWKLFEIGPNNRLIRKR